MKSALNEEVKVQMVTSLGGSPIRRLRWSSHWRKSHTATSLLSHNSYASLEVRGAGNCQGVLLPYRITTASHIIDDQQQHLACIIFPRQHHPNPPHINQELRNQANT